MGACPLISHSVNSVTINRSSLLAAPKNTSQCCRLTESVLPGPAPPESRSATAVTVLLVISTGKSSDGRSGYEYRLSAVGGRASTYFVRSISITISPIFVHPYVV